MILYVHIILKYTMREIFRCFEELLTNTQDPLHKLFKHALDAISKLA